MTLQENVQKASDSFNNIKTNIATYVPSVNTSATYQYAEKVKDVYKAGKDKIMNDFYDTFWDAFQEKGERYSYYQTFSSSIWNDETFNPKYKTFTSSAYGGIAGNSTFKNNSTIVNAIRDNGVDFILVGNCNRFALGAIHIKYFNLIDTVKIHDQNCTNILTNCSALLRIERLIMKSTAVYQGLFYGCPKLEYIGFEGSIGMPINVSYCPKLEALSLRKLINCLETKTDGVEHKIYLGEINLAKLTEVEKKVAQDKGWTLV